MLKRLCGHLGRTDDGMTAVERHTIQSRDSCDRIHSRDLRVGASEHLDRGGQPVQYLRAAAGTAEAVEVVYLPDNGRAGVARGGDASWTDAGGAGDALERYFGVNGKEMVGQRGSGSAAPEGGPRPPERRGGLHCGETKHQPTQEREGA